LDHRYRQLALVSDPLTHPLLGGGATRRVRHRLALYYAAPTHARAMAVALRSVDTFPDSGRVAAASRAPSSGSLDQIRLDEFLEQSLGLVSILCPLHRVAAVSLRAEEAAPMGEAQTLLLGFIARVTILLGLPLGRMRAPAPGLRVFLNAVAIGILVFLVWDVLTHAWGPVDAALGALHDGAGGLGSVLGYGRCSWPGSVSGCSAWSATSIGCPDAPPRPRPLEPPRAVPGRWPQPS
jgi:hypothetical protein